MQFTSAERAEIAEILGLRDDNRADLVITAIEGELSVTRAEGAAHKAVRRVLSRAGGASLPPRPRGRPRGARRELELVGDCYYLAGVYELWTGVRVTTERTGPFYRLAQVCLRYADPAKVIRKIDEAPWFFSGTRANR